VSSPKLTRLLVVATVAAGFGILPMPGARADSAVFVYDLPKGFSQTDVPGQCHSTKDPNQMPRIDVDKGASVSWYMDQGNQDKHNIVPANDVPGGQKWPSVPNGKSPDMAAGEGGFTVKFDNPGLYFYYSNFNKDGSDNKGTLDGMCGVIHVNDPNPPAPTTTAPPATTTTTQAPTTTTHPATPGPTPTTAPVPGPPVNHPSGPAAPATTTTAKADTPKDPKKNETTTTTVLATGPVDLPAEAIVPNVTPGGTATQDGVVQPASTPTGDATAFIKQKHGHGPLILLIVSGLGVCGLGIGTAAYKWANRSSKYFPA
jgi:plastocyanin